MIRPPSTETFDSLSAALDRHVEAGRGGKIAYIASDATLTYADLRRQASRMGHVLREHGVRREQRVLLVLDDTTVFPIAFLGAMRIGAVPVAVSALDTAENLRYFVEDSYAEVIVCDADSVSTLRDVLRDHDVRYLARGARAGEAVELDDALAGQDDELAAVATHPDDMAFWLYSSGSTGTPKGVVHAHRSVTAISETFARQVLGICEEDRIFSTSKLHHAYALGNSLSFSLYFGATAILLDGPPQPERLLRIVREQRPTVLFSVPALYELLVGDSSADGAFDSVRLCISASAPLPEQTYDRWRERFGIEIIDGIGSTEMLSTYCSNVPGDVVRGTTGRPVPGYELRLSDEAGRVLDGPAIGELEVRGHSRAAFYWHQSEKARRCMRGEWFASGDRFERRVDGTYVYVGRTDDMFKVGGLWVSPVDIERVLLEHSAVAHVGVVGVTIGNHTRIAAVVECSQRIVDEDELAQTLRLWCKERMRGYEYPHIVRFVEQLPRTLTGKPQRFKLRELVEQQTGSSVEQQTGSSVEQQTGRSVDASPRPRQRPHLRVRDAIRATWLGGKRAKSAASALEGPTPSRLAAHPRKGADMEAESRRERQAWVESGDERLPRELESGDERLPRGLVYAPAHERARKTIEMVCVETASVLGRNSTDAIEPHRAFKELGFDSVAAVELRNRLSIVTGLELPSTLAFDHPTPVAVAQRLRQLLEGVGRQTPALGEARALTDDPIAIVGMSCRYPGGVRSPEDLWRLLASGTDAISGFPTERGWRLERLYDPDPESLGTSYVRTGGFLYDAAEFDAGFFGISPREAVTVDPQQRLLLETTWEAFEDAGIDPTSLHGTDTGVFAGVMYQDYGVSLSLSANNPEAEGYALLGSSGSVASGRVAYALGLQGPAVTVDTACSSSLVALHLAGQSLRAGECSLALAGGVTVMATPGPFVEYSRQRGLARDGRCKSFSDSADGTGFSEGVGIVLLERLSDALRNGHSVLTIVRGSAVNQDGASNGLTAPNGPSQERVIRQALANACLSTRDVDVVEGHGTGTTLGDPIEAQALLATYGHDRGDRRPLWLGSVKSNIGHTQAAAGVAGVIKMVKALEHGVLPKTLHVDEPSRHVDWSVDEVRLLTEEVAWSGDGDPRRVGVSSFGVSGTNAHVILEEPPRLARPDRGTLASAPFEDGLIGESARSGASREVLGGGEVPWVVSGRGAGALRAQAERVHEFVRDATELAPLDVGFSLAERAALSHRAVVIGGNREGLLEGLGAFAYGRSEPGLIEGIADEVAGEVVFVFPGQGSQWEGMAAQLLDQSSVFAERLRECEAALSRFVDWSVEGVLRGDVNEPGLDRIDVVQPVLFAVMVGLAGLWRACGVQPAAVVGHSQGEIAAAHIAGGLSLEDAARVVALRSRVLARLAGEGGIVSVSLPAAEVLARIERWQHRIELAGVNGPASATVSGDEEALKEFVRECVADNVRARLVADTVASHSPRVDALREELCDLLASIAPRAGDVPFYSTVTGGLMDMAELDAGYWFLNMRQPVQFESATRVLLDDGFRVFIEVSPHPVLTFGVQETVDEVLGRSGAVVGDTLRRDEGGLKRFLGALGEAWVRGVGVDWVGVFEGCGARRVGLPTYAFQRKRFWLDAGTGTGDMVSAGQASVEHPLLGAAVASADDGRWLFTGRLSLQSHPWLADHVVMGVVLLPGTVFLELALHAGGQVGCDAVRELTLQVPLVLDEHDAVALQISVGELDGSGERSIGIYSCLEDGSGGGALAERSWTLHANGVLKASDAVAGGLVAGERAEALAGESWPPVGTEVLRVDGLYDELAGVGIEYGPAFQGLRGAWRRGEEVFAEVVLDEQRRDEARSFGVHPALLDSALHAAGLAIPDGSGVATSGWVTVALPGGERDAADGDVRLPFSWCGVELYATGASSLRVHIAPIGGGALSLDLADQDGEPVGSVTSLQARSISPEQLQTAHRAHHDSLFTIDWASVTVSTDAGGAPLVVLDEEGSTLAASLNRAGHSPVVYRDLASLSDAIGEREVNPEMVLVDCDSGGPNVSGAISVEDASARTGLSSIVHETAHRVLELVQAWLSDPRFESVRLVLVSRGAVIVRSGEDVVSLSHTPVWGLVRSAQSENPGRFVLVDVDGDDASWGVLDSALACAEAQMAVRDGEVYVPRLKRAPTSRDEVVQTIDPRGTVLITGGTGALGGLVARHLVMKHGVRHLLLASRRGTEAEGATHLRAQLESAGAQVKITACDVADRRDLAALLESVPSEFPLRGVVHAAGVLDDGVIESLTAERLDGVLAPKADAAWSLHELTEHLGLSMFILFSSVSGTFGSPGRGSDAAASAFLDMLAAYRRARSLAGTSIAWGLWEGEDEITGEQSAGDSSRIERLGMRALSHEQGLELFDTVCARDEAFVVTASLDLGALSARARMGALPALLGGLIRMPRRRAGEQGGTLARRIAGLPEAEHRAVALEIVQEQIAAVLGHASTREVDPRRAFKDLGFDSLAAVELRNRLTTVTGLRLPATLAFDHPNAAAIVSYLLNEIAGIQTKASVAVSVVGVDEPIAIVGMSCRYPGGASSPRELWELLVRGADVISSFPTDRGWDLEGLYDPDPAHLGTSYAREGGFLYDAGEFDADFFGISPREALAMDPQQRLLLEVSWETLENAGIDPVSLRGSQTGVYTGISSADYGLGVSGLTARGLEGYRLTGGAGSVASGRVAYAFGLEGPAVSVDTACSSSLVALHLACGALRSGECSLALAGGVTVMSSPTAYVEFSAQRGLARDGRCKSFAAVADGIGWSEGVGVVLVERLSDAQRRGHEVLALVRGSAINQDGASNGLTAPNGPSQQRVIVQALANARLAASQVGVVEAHGTGTTLGDPIEAQALLATYGQDPPEGRTVWLGSVKSNIGHTAAAAGVAGVIKTVMAMRHGVLPKTLHVDAPSGDVDWSAGAVSLLTEQIPWPRNGEPRRAGVSSFGVSGTNAHMILEEAPTAPTPPSDSVAVDRDDLVTGDGELVVADSSRPMGDALIASADWWRVGMVPWVFSAKSDRALRAQAARLSERVALSPELGALDVGFSLVSRSRFESRAVLLGGDRAETASVLGAFARAEPAAGVVQGTALPDGELAFLFPGQGSQWEGMAVELLDASPVFAAHMRTCAEALAPYVDWSLEGVLRGDTAAPGLDRVDVVQPLLFAVMISLAGLWRACGVHPDVVIGHSQGEIAAAHVVGALSLEDAAQVIALRSRALRDLAGKGGMASIALGVSEVRARIECWGERISVAAVNGPSAVVVSGDVGALAELLEKCAADGVRARMIPVDYAAHSSQVEAIREELLEGCSAIKPRPSDMPFYSTVTGGLLDTAELDSEYWYRNLRETVQFERTMQAALEDGHSGFIEVSPHPVLTVGVQETVDEVLAGADAGDACDAVVVGSLLRGEGGLARFLGALAEVWVRGVDVDWGAVFAGSGARRVGLPTYAFQRERFWLDAGAGGGNMISAGQASAGHPLLGAAVALADDRGWLFTGRLSLQSHPWLSDHAVMGAVLLPATAFLELALHAGSKVECGVVAELVLEAPLVLPEHGAVQLQVSVGELDQSGHRPIAIHTRLEDTSNESVLSEQPWTLHANGVLSSSDEIVNGSAVQERAAMLAGESWPPADAEVVEVDGLYDELVGMGIEYGPVFQGLRNVWRRGEEVFAEVALPEAQRGDAESFSMHPALLGAALQTTGVVMPDGLGVTLPGWLGAALPEVEIEAQGGLRLPFSWGGVVLYAMGAPSLRVHLAPVGEGEVSLVVADENGEMVAAVGSLISRQIDPEHLRSKPSDHRESLFGIDWTPVSIGPLPDNGETELVVLGNEDSRIAREIKGAGAHVSTYRDLCALGEALERGVAPGVVLFDAHDLVDADNGEGDTAGDVLATGDAAADGLAGSLGGGSEEYLPELAQSVVCGVLGVLQDWLSDEKFAGCRLIVVTKSALPVRSGERVWGLACSGVWGLVRSAQSEHPDRFLVVDTDGRESSSSALRVVLAREGSYSDEPQLAIREGEVLAPRLARVGSGGMPVTPGGVEFPTPAAFDGTMLITGGTGGLGALIARHLVGEHGLRNLVLASRRGLDTPGAAELQGELESLGAHVCVAACDVSDRDAVRELLEQIPAEYPLRGVVHAAGTRDNGVIGSLTGDGVGTVLAPKVHGAWHLHELTKHLDLSMFVLFSSVAGTLGFPGQGNYAAANSFLDALATYRRARGLAGTSIAWGYWEQASEVSGALHESDLARVARQGVLPISAEEGLNLFDRARASEEAALVAVRIDTAEVRAQARNGLLPSLMSKLVRVPSRRTVDAGSLARRLAGVPEAERQSVVLELVRGEVAIVLGHSSATAIDAERAFKDLGFDSLASVELRNRLNTITGLHLPATVAFDHPNTAVLTRYLLEQAGGIEQRRRSLPIRSGGDSDDLVAIVGMSCRYPGGVRSPQDLWELVTAGRDAIGGFPTDRGWDLERLFDPDPDHPGTSYAREGGFLYDVADFDAEFFGVSPREALAMDAQQRLLLEASWEAIEGADVDPTTLRGSQTGVFTGVTYHDYGTAAQRPPEDLEGYMATGVAGSVASGRVAYVFGLEGPAITVDTACSSSLVALHWACHSLRTNECSLALAGGVTVLASPAPFLEFSRQRGLAVDGRCKAFSAGADGIGFAEGVGVVLLERLSDAVRDGRRVLAVVRGGAVNQDGASNGLTAPNGPSQERVIRQALANAGLSTTDVDVVEAHGTGTSLGDPIEAQALLATYGCDRSQDDPLWLGSVKSNIGHTQAAAGVAGVIKIVKALEHGVLPPTLHVDEPTKHVDWSSGYVSLLSEHALWVRNGEPRRAGVSSFGISGTNAHVILEEAPVDGSLTEGTLAGGAPVDRMDAGLPVFPWVLSGRGVMGLRGQAERLAGFLTSDESGSGVGDVGLSLTGRPMFDHRAVIVGGDREGLVGGLGVVAHGDSASGVVSGCVGGGETVFMFTGQGSQRVGMGRELYEVFGEFRDVFDAVCAGFDEWLGGSLKDVVLGVGVERVDDGLERLDDTAIAQPALFAFEVALFSLLEHWGARPHFLMGHSVGEIVAAHVAGVFSLEDACALVAARGRLMGESDEDGAMVSVAASEEEVSASLAGLESRVVIAGVNGPCSVVVSGDEDAVLDVAEGWRERGSKTKRLRVSHAFHSPHMDGMLEEFAAVLEGLSFAPPSIPIVSNLTGEAVLVNEVCSVEYWVRHVREPVRFMDGVRWLVDRGASKFLELGPDGVLSGMTQECLEDCAERGDLKESELSSSSAPQMRDGGSVCAPVLRGERPEVESMFTALGEAWVCGMDVDWARVFDGRGLGRVGLPSYAFQRQRFWLGGGSGAGDVRSIGLRSIDHPLLGAVVGLAGGEGWLFSGRVSLEDNAWLSDHAVMGTVLFPGSGLLDLVLCAGREVGCDVVRELVLEAPLVLDRDHGVRLQVIVGDTQEDGARSVSVFSCAENASDWLDADKGSGSQEGWVRHANGVLGTESDIESDGGGAQEAMGGAGVFGGVWPPEGATRIKTDDLYARLVDIGLEYGPIFRGLTGAWRRGSEVFCEVRLPDGHTSHAGAFAIHPALLDAALHATALLDGGDWDATGGIEGTGVRLPFSWERVRIGALGASSLRVRLSTRGNASTTGDPLDSNTGTGDGGALSLVAADEAGMPVLFVGSLLTRPVSSAQLQKTRSGPHESLFNVQWMTPQMGAIAEDQANTVSDLVLLGQDESRVGRALADTGMSVRTYQDIDALRDALQNGGSLPPIVLLDAGYEGFNGPLGNGIQPDSGSVSAGACGAVCGVLDVLRDWLSDERFAGSRLAVLSTDAVPVCPGDQVTGLVLSGVWGLVRSAQSENPERFMLIDADLNDSGDEGADTAFGGLLGAALLSGEPQLAIRDGELLVPVLARVAGRTEDKPVDGDDGTSAQRGDDGPLELGSDGASAQPGDGGPLELGADGAVLITGGTGGLGALVARHLVLEHGVGCVVLASRSGLEAPGAAELEAELVQAGARVQVVACDVSNRDALTGLLEDIPDGFPLRGVVHAAGILDDGVIGSLTGERMERVFAPKAEAAWHLHELTEHMDLSMFVLFSSGAATMGASGQGNYAAANTFLDSLAAYRRARNLPGTSIAWGLWKQTGGMTGGLGESDMTRMARTGVLGFSAGEGLELFDLVCGMDDASVVAVRFDGGVLRAGARAGMLPALLRGLVRMPVQRAASGGSLARRLAGVPEAERENTVLELVRAAVAMVLGHTSADTVDPSVAFKDLGFDSLAAVELRNRLSTMTGLRLPATLIFDYPNAILLTRHLRGEVEGSDNGVPSESGEAEIRQALESIPLTRLRKAGLLETLLQLANPEGTTLGVTDDSPDRVDAMDVEDLVMAAMSRSAGEV